MPRAIAEVPVGTESATASGRTPAVHLPEASSSEASLNPSRKDLLARSSKSSCEVTSLRPSAERGWAPGRVYPRVGNVRERAGSGHSGGKMDLAGGCRVRDDEGMPSMGFSAGPTAKKRKTDGPATDVGSRDIIFPLV
jgi:hypothetical protein